MNSVQSSVCTYKPTHSMPLSTIYWDYAQTILLFPFHATLYYILGLCTNNTAIPIPCHSLLYTGTMHKQYCYSHSIPLSTIYWDYAQTILLFPFHDTLYYILGLCTNNTAIPIPYHSLLYTGTMHKQYCYSHSMPLSTIYWETMHKQYCYSHSIPLSTIYWDYAQTILLFPFHDTLYYILGLCTNNTAIPIPYHSLLYTGTMHKQYCYCSRMYIAQCHITVKECLITFHPPFPIP